jgi:hypothetical protein
MSPFKRGCQSRRTAQIRGNFVAPNRKAKSPAVIRKHREPIVSARKCNTVKVF